MARLCHGGVEGTRDRKRPARRPGKVDYDAFISNPDVDRDALEQVTVPIFDPGPTWSTGLLSGDWRNQRRHHGITTRSNAVIIAYYHASRFGNGAMVAEEFRRQAVSLGAMVDVHHIRETDPKHLPPADLYVFSSPGQWGKPIKQTRRFLGELTLPAGTKYALLTTEIAPSPDKKTGLVPTEEERAKWQRVRPMMNETLQAAGLERVAEETILVTAIKGPLEAGWKPKVEDFARLVMTSVNEPQKR